MGTRRCVSWPCFGHPCRPPLKKKKSMMCSTGALLCSQTLISLRHRRHRRPPANAKCIGLVFMLQDIGHAEGVPIATPRGRSVSFPFSGNYGYIRNLRRLCAKIQHRHTYVTMSYFMNNLEINRHNSINRHSLVKTPRC